MRSVIKSQNLQCFGPLNTVNINASGGDKQHVVLKLFNLGEYRALVTASESGIITIYAIVCPLFPISIVAKPNDILESEYLKIEPLEILKFKILGNDNTGQTSSSHGDFYFPFKNQW